MPRAANLAPRTVVYGAEVVNVVSASDICAHFGIDLSPAFVDRELKIVPLARFGHLRMWRKTDLPAIGRALIEHIEARLAA